MNVAFAGFRHNHIFSLYTQATENSNIKILGCFEEDEQTRQNVMIDYKLSDDEFKTIDIVVNKFYSFTSKDIVKYMHKEKAYLETKTNEFISFEYAKYIDLR